MSKLVNIKTQIICSLKLLCGKWQWLCVLSVPLCLVSLWGFGNATTIGASNENVANVKDILSEWVETQRLISKEKQDWALGQQLLADRIEFMQTEIDELQGTTKTNIDEANKFNQEQDKLNAENDELKKGSAVFLATIEELELRVGNLLKNLPSYLQDRVQALSQRLPKEGAEIQLSLGERYQNVMGILLAINKFNREIAITSEVRDLKNGTSVEVACMYLGIGQAYYVNSDSTIAGVGRATASGWEWFEDNAAAENIQTAIAITKNEKVAEYVQLPLSLYADSKEQ